MAAVEMGAARQGWEWAAHRGLGLKLAVGQRDGYGVVGLMLALGGKWGGRGREPCLAPCGPVPAGPEGPTGGQRAG